MSHTVAYKGRIKEVDLGLSKMIAVDIDFHESEKLALYRGRIYALLEKIEIPLDPLLQMHNIFYAQGFKQDDGEIEFVIIYKNNGATFCDLCHYVLQSLNCS